MTQLCGYFPRLELGSSWDADAVDYLACPLPADHDGSEGGPESHQWHIRMKDPKPPVPDLLGALRASLPPCPHPEWRTHGGALTSITTRVEPRGLDPRRTTPPIEVLLRIDHDQLVCTRCGRTMAQALTDGNPR